MKKPMKLPNSPKLIVCHPDDECAARRVLSNMSREESRRWGIVVTEKGVKGKFAIFNAQQIRSASKKILNELAKMN